ncbi:NAD-dependent epimerase/dehydratase family protein [Candidatus Margulisiibacteriota bacterium]
MKKIFITGISGCVGHYLYDVLGNDPNYELYLFVRTPKNIKFDYKANPRVKLIHDDLNNIKKHAEIIRQMDYVIHLAAQWGGHQLNLDYSLDFFNLLDPAQCKKVIYFSTASILDQNNQPIEEARKFGTHYIRSKYDFLKKLPELRIYPNIITLFPTWVLGGDKNHPYSHASSGLREIEKWLWLVRFLTIDASFHFIHAADIAQIVKHLLENDTTKKELVLGNQLYTASQFIKEVCEFYNKKIYGQIPIPLSIVKPLASLTGHKLHSWDEFCLKKKYFQHQTVNADTFGLPANLKTVSQILSNML